MVDTLDRLTALVIRSDDITRINVLGYIFACLDKRQYADVYRYITTITEVAK